MRIAVLSRVLLFLSCSRCYVAQHLESGPLPVSVPLRHLHGHCVVCYTVERWLVFVAVISAGSERTSVLNRVSSVFK